MAQRERALIVYNVILLLCCGKLRHCKVEYGFSHNYYITQVVHIIYSIVHVFSVVHMYLALSTWNHLHQRHLNPATVSFCGMYIPLSDDKQRFVRDRSLCALEIQQCLNNFFLTKNLFLGFCLRVNFVSDYILNVMYM